MYQPDYNKINLKKVTRTVNLIVPSQAAKLTPPVGPILGQFRIKVKDFCENFNNQTKDISYGLPLKVTLFIYKDKSFDYLIKAPSTMFLVKNLLKNKSDKSLNVLDLYKIVLIKKSKQDLYSLESVFKNLLSTLKSMNIKI